MKSVAFALLFACLPTVVLADAEVQETEANPQVMDVEQYNYDTKLDVKKVISIKSDTTACGMTPAEMIYEDSHGSVHEVKYMVMGYGCSNG